MTQRRVKHGGCKVRERRKGEQGRQAGNGAKNATEHITGDGDGANEAQRQCAWENDGDDGVTPPTHAAAGAACRGKGDPVGDRHRGEASSTRSAAAAATMVVSEALLGGGSPYWKPRGGSGPRAFLGLMDSTQLAGLAPNSQGVASPTKG